MSLKIGKWLWWFFCAPRSLVPPRLVVCDVWAARLGAFYKQDPGIHIRSRRLEAGRAVAWAEDMEKFGDKHVVKIPSDAARVTQTWLLGLDWIEIGVIATAGLRRPCGAFRRPACACAAAEGM